LSPLPVQNSTHSNLAPFLPSPPCRAQLNSLPQFSSSYLLGEDHIENTVLLLLRASSFPRERVYRAIAQNDSLFIRPLRSSGCTRLFRGLCLAAGLYATVCFFGSAAGNREEKSNHLVTYNIFSLFRLGATIYTVLSFHSFTTCFGPIWPSSGGDYFAILSHCHTL
jgi:hypothetical protein